jgi:hypothetical protein
LKPAFCCEIVYKNQNALLLEWRDLVFDLAFPGISDGLIKFAFGLSQPVLHDGVATLPKPSAVGIEVLYMS